MLKFGLFSYFISFQTGLVCLLYESLDKAITQVNRKSKSIRFGYSFIQLEAR